jgi:glycosyltransferase involved in cell wall biosynthesis
MKKKQRILAFHLFNDRSGSPKVLRQLLVDWAKHEEFQIHLFTSKKDDGFLTEISKIETHNSWYQYSSNPWLRLVLYTSSQIILLIKMLFFIKKGDIVYINTILPFGAAIAGKIKSCRIIYHIHEVSIKPKPLKWFLLFVVRKTSKEVIYVSNFVKETINIPHKPSHIVYNSIENSFLDSILEKRYKPSVSNILMVCSLKKYKGIFEFLDLAKSLPQYQFRLVLNANDSEIKAFFSGSQLPKNLTTFSVQKNLHPFYHWADMILNLSHTDEWVETFGLTIIEGMAYSLPSIVPPVGGILEVIEDGITGFVVDSRDTMQLIEKIERIFEDTNLYHKMSIAAHERLGIFSEENMLTKVREILVHIEQ